MLTVKSIELSRITCALIALSSILPQHLVASERPKPPEVFQQLVEQGNVKFDFYDRSVERPRFAGHANYRISVRSRFNYDYRIVVRSNVRYVRITPKIQQLTWTVGHTVRLPETLDGPEFWSDVLVKHEFDHVAISTDPRVRMLMEHLIRNLRTIDHRFNRFDVPSRKELQQIIDEEHAKRRDAVLAVVQRQYQRLDELTDHGNRELPDRDTFFHNLYTKSGLDEAQFPYLGEVLDLLKSRKYQKAPLLFHSALNDDGSRRKKKNRRPQIPRRNTER